MVLTEGDIALPGDKTLRENLLKIAENVDVLAAARFVKSLLVPSGANFLHQSWKLS